MQVKLDQAVKMFFGNSSLEMVYFEAIANALDANATEIEIKISAKAFNQPESLEIAISDNGIGFTNDRYEKFSNLFDADEHSHKGLGRLVYLCYFNSIEVTSHYDKTKKREFCFSEGFDEKSCNSTDVPEIASGTNFNMTGYTLQKIAKSDFVTPDRLKRRILEEFYSRFFQLIEKKSQVQVKITSNIEGCKRKVVLDESDIPKLSLKELNSSINLIDKLSLYYSIEKVGPHDRSLIAAISVDNRTVKVDDIIADENIPRGYKMVFLLYSDFFTGKVDAVRKKLTIPKTDLKKSKIFSEKKLPPLLKRKFQK